MHNYLLSKDAEQDLRDIARYTLDKWGQKQFLTYRQLLKNKFEAIGKGSVITHQFSENLPDIYVTKAGSHFVFYLAPKTSKPVIIAVLHEARDFMRHLTSRLNVED